MKTPERKKNTGAGVKERKPPAKSVAAHQQAAALPMNAEQALALYRQMLRIRRFETTCNELYLGGRIPGMSPHLYIGEEAVAPAICFFLRKDDYIVSNHR